MAGWSALRTLDLSRSIRSSDEVRVAAPRDFKGGRRFEAVAEQVLYPQAVQVARTLRGTRSEVILLPEMPGPIGIPDFVAIIGGHEEIELRLLSGVGPVESRIDISIVAQLSSRRPTRPEQIQFKLGLDSDYLGARIRRLRQADAVHSNVNGSLLLNPVIEPAGRVIAIETKLRDWRRAIHQARRYRTWAENYVVIAGDISTDSQILARETAILDGGGLYVDGVWLTKPRRRAVSRLSRVGAYEAVIAAMSGYQPSSSTSS